MTPETMIQFATPVAMIVLIVMQKRDAARIAEKVVITAAATAADVKTELDISSKHRDSQLRDIHQLVNSEMSKAQDKIDKQRDEITALKKLLMKQKK